MPQRKTTTVMVERQEQIDQVCADARTQGRFAFDTEFVMEDVAKAEVCLIQLALEDGVFLVDQYKGLDMTPIWALVADPEVETVAHAGQEDLNLCVHAFGKAPRNVFDVQIAAGLVGPDYPLSLTRLAQTILHIRLHKSQTLTDWRKRPLSAEQKRYAVEDVAYLLRIRRKLGEQLDRAGRESWAREEFSRLEDIRLYRRTESDRLRRVKGVGHLTPQQLAVATELMLWREQMAEKLNRPARAVLKDHLLSEIARTGLSQPKQIRSLRGINLSNRHVEDLCSVLQRALELPPQRWPEVKSGRPETARETVLTVLMTAVIRSECLRLNLAYALTAAKRDIQELVRSRLEHGRHPHGTGKGKGKRTPRLLRGWRGEAIGTSIEAVLARKASVQIDFDDPATVLAIKEA